jgi:hypothetical protein
MAKKNRRTYQTITGELVRYLQATEDAGGVSLETNARGEQAFVWDAPIKKSRITGPRPALLCRMPVEIFEYFYGVYEWHIEDPKPAGQQGELF